MNWSFHPEALEEYQQATLYYDERRRGLGTRFVLEVESAIHKLLQHPKRYPSIDDGIRRCLLRTFPYGVLYSIEPEFVLIVAIMHSSREPGYWKDRRSK